MNIAAIVFAATVLTGGSRMIEVDGKYHVWTDRVGKGPVKMLTLHGGPGFPHDYLECFEDFLPQHGVQFYYYDQLGVGNSDQPNDDALCGRDSVSIISISSVIRGAECWASSTPWRIRII